MKKHIIISCAVLSAVVVVITIFYLGILRFNYPSKDKFPIRGIDISHHQEQIDWEKLKEENLDFVYVKATEGGDYVDDKFQLYWKKSKESGYKTGAYHFYRFCKNGKEQAENFIRHVPKDSSSLPPVVDLEFGGNCKSEKSEKLIISEIQDFLNLLEEHYKRTPILYVTPEFYEKFIEASFMRYPLWYRDIYFEPKLADDRTIVFWQYANKGSIKGIEGDVDLNVFFGKKWN